MSDPVIGILGGIGPAATADFYSKLVALTPGSTDQEHPKVVIWADPTVPDRTLALTENGPDPTPWLIRGARVLRESGATTLAIPCNTARSEEHTSELQSLMRISYAVYCLKKKKTIQ